jgi:hypothetical protein
MAETLEGLFPWLDGNELEKRAIVAALCEPKLLKSRSHNLEILKILIRLTQEFDKVSGKLTDKQDSLRKTLGYGWSVLIVSLPEEGKQAFEKLIENRNKNIRWIVRENLKNKRLQVMDRDWLEKTVKALPQKRLQATHTGYP